MTDYICTSCDYMGQRKKMKPGSSTIEWMLWLILLVPGPFYTAWRIFGSRWACPHCGETNMVPVHSKAGKKAQAASNAAISPENLTAIPDRWQKDREDYAKKMKEMLENDRKAVMLKSQKATTPPTSPPLPAPQQPPARPVKNPKKDEPW